MANIPKKPVNQPSAKPANQPSAKPQVAPVNVSNIQKDVLKKTNTQTDDNKKKKRRLLLLLILLLIVFVAGMSVLIYFVTKPSDDINLTLTITTKINGEIIGPGTTMPDKKFVPGDEIPLELNFKIYDPSVLENSNAKVYARYKISAFVDDTYVSGLFDPLPIQGNTLDVIKGDDNYFYYKKVFASENRDIVAFRALNFVPEYENNILNGKSVNIKIELEILEANFYAIRDVWSLAPNEWRELVKPYSN